MTGPTDASSASECLFIDAEQSEWCIGVVLTHEQNRNLLEQWLSASYDVVAPDPDAATLSTVAESADMLLLDAGAYTRYEELVTLFKADDDSLFQPVLLLVGDDGSPRNPEIWMEVDDVITTPIEKGVLQARINGLLSRRRLTRELASSEDRFRRLFDTGPDPALVIDERGKVQDSNAAFRRILGLDVEECHDRFLSTFDGFDEPTVETLVSLPAANSVDDSRVVITYRSQRGEVRFAECRTSVLNLPAAARETTDSGDRIVILRDITERIHRERELNHQVERLDEFAGILAHELRNPLSIALGWLEQAQTSGDPDAFDRVETALHRMHHMINELLQLAQQGRVIGETSAVLLQSLVSESWSEVSTEDTALDISPQLEDLMVTGDRNRLKEVFTNLFRNAIDHGGSVSTITVGLDEDGNGIYVEDDGVGFGDTDLERLFEAGYTTADHGTGFGLAIVKQIADAHGWTVEATSSAAGGARLELRDITIEDSTSS